MDQARSYRRSRWQVHPGAIASDSQGNLHILFTHTPDEALPIGIDYIYWNGVEWSAPVSVLVNANGANTWMPRLVIDRSDMMHVIWVDGASLYYASSPAADAGSAQSWSSPAVIGQAIFDSDRSGDRVTRRFVCSLSRFVVAGPDFFGYVN